MIYDPLLKLYLPLDRKDGTYFMSDDAHGHLCTVTGAVWSPQGRYFDGTDDIISVADSPVLSFGNGTTDVVFSASWWAKITAATNPRFFSKGGAAKYEYTVGTDGADHLLIQLQSGGSGTAGDRLKYISTATMPFGAWTMFSFVYDGTGSGTSIKAYFNTTQKAGNITDGGTYTAMNDYDQPLTIGKLWNDSANYITGYMDDLIIYRQRELTVADITRRFNETRWRFR